MPLFHDPVRRRADSNVVRPCRATSLQGEIIDHTRLAVTPRGQNPPLNLLFPPSKSPILSLHALLAHFVFPSLPRQPPPIMHTKQQRLRFQDSSEPSMVLLKMRPSLAAGTASLTPVSPADTEKQNAVANAPCADTAQTSKSPVFMPMANETGSRSEFFLRPTCRCQTRFRRLKQRLGSR